MSVQAAKPRIGLDPREPLIEIWISPRKGEVGGNAMVPDTPKGNVSQQSLFHCVCRAQGATVLLSSQDLAEIETFTSHVGYLERGRLDFSEEMNSLVERFREVEVTFESLPPLPAEWPEDWMQPDTSTAVLRFVDTRFDRERTASEIRRLFGDVRDVSFNPMSLRSIFVALAKHARADA
jgi:ABC-type multidrug transport system ATPase subunit